MLRNYFKSKRRGEGGGGGGELGNVDELKKWTSLNPVSVYREN